MATATEPPRRRTLWKLAVFLILVGLALSGFSGWLLVAMQKTAAAAAQRLDTITQDFQTLLEKGEKVGETFLNNIREDRLDQAYAVTTAAFRSHTSREAFEELVKLNPPLKQDLGPPEFTVGGGRLAVDFWSGRINSTKANMDLHTTGSEKGGDKARLRVILVVEGQKPLVEELFIEGLVRGQ